MTVVIGECSQYCLGYCAELSEKNDVQYPCSAVLIEDCEVKQLLWDTDQAVKVN